MTAKSVLMRHHGLRPGACPHLPFPCYATAVTSLIRAFNSCILMIIEQ